jgi:hypothetical protein
MVTGEQPPGPNGVMVVASPEYGDRMGWVADHQGGGSSLP